VLQCVSGGVLMWNTCRAATEHMSPSALVVIPPLTEMGCYVLFLWLCGCMVVFCAGVRSFVRC
jgi:hypothetical protein